MDQGLGNHNSVFCFSSISRLSETVEDLSFQVEQLTVILKRSSLYREMSVTSIPDTINSSQSTSPDETGQLSYSYGHKSRLKPSNMVSSTHHDAWSIPCVFKCIGTLRYVSGSACPLPHCCRKPLMLILELLEMPAAYWKEWGID